MSQVLLLPLRIGERIGELLRIGERGVVSKTIARRTHRIIEDLYLVDEDYTTRSFTFGNESWKECLMRLNAG